MCDPTTIMVASGVGSVLQAYSGYQQGQAAQAQANYQAQLAANNAVLAERNARDALERGRNNEADSRIATAQLAGTQRARFAAAGIDLTSGSPLDILGDTAEQGELDALIIRNNAAREAYGFNLEASNQQAEAQNQRIAGRNAARQGVVRAGATLLTGAATVGDQYIRYRTQGAFN